VEVPLLKPDRQKFAYKMIGDSLEAGLIFQEFRTTIYAIDEMQISIRVRVSRPPLKDNLIKPKGRIPATHL
jgi:hypothetical protein